MSRQVGATLRVPTRDETCGNNRPGSKCYSLACKKLHLTRDQYNDTVQAVRFGKEPKPEPWMGEALAK